MELHKKRCQQIVIGIHSVFPDHQRFDYSPAELIILAFNFSKMQRIAIDMDEVIADVYPRFYDWYERDFNLKIDQQLIQGKYLRDIVPTAHREKVANYLHVDGFFKDLPVIADSKEVLYELSKKYELFIASAAMEFKYIYSLVTHRFLRRQKHHQRRLPHR